MRERRRYGGEIRTRFPRQDPWARVRDYENSSSRHENRERHSRHVSSSSREPERSGRFLSGESGSRGLVERRDHDRNVDGDSDRDRDRDSQQRRLSQFNEDSKCRESTSMKFQWEHLLSEPLKSNVNMNQTSKHSTDDGLSASRVSTERNYQGSGFSDVGRSGVLVEKPSSVEIERARIHSPYPPEVGISRSSGPLDGGFSRNMNVGLHKDTEDLHFQDHLHMNKLPADRLSAREEEKPNLYLRDTCHYMISSPQSKAFATGSYNDGPHIHSDGFSQSSGMITKLVARNGHCQTLHMKSPAEIEVPLNDVMNYRHPQPSPSERKYRDFMYPEVGRNEKGGKMTSVQEEFGHRDSLSAGIVDPIFNRINVTEGSHRSHLSESRQRVHSRSSQEQPISNYLDASGTSHSRQQDGEVVVYRNTHLDYERQVHLGHECLPFGEDYGHGKDAVPRSLEERLDMLPMIDYDPHLNGIDGGSRKRSTVEELGLHEPSRKMLKQKHGVDKKVTRHHPINKFLSNGKTTCKIQELGGAAEQWTGEEMDPLFLPKKSRFSHTQYRKAGSTSDEMGRQKISYSGNRLSSNNLSVSMPRHLSKPHKIGARDIKKRLRPGPPNVHISHPLVKKYKPNKFQRRIHGDFHGNLHVQRGGPTEVVVTPAKTEPPESSEDFKQLVHSAFFKFVKQLNENLAQRRRFMVQGKADGLKCSICGSNSNEFVDTESLVMHACTSPKVGFKAQHLGFHKALCVLMGWKSAVALNRSWICQVLPDNESLALKEDLIIWPPVVVIHNSSISNYNPDERVIVSIEVLEALLGDMGFGEKTKVCRGKPANQSIMVVKFNSTFSGLQEAERLHKFYTENKRGRAEFQQVNQNSSGSSSDETRKASSEKVENVLYGYLGIAEDLDKLDFETKKWCLVKSKKEIQEIADTPLKSE
uniref:XS domain-containing protein n=1 Tax=Davidia involucrata TaxID=16924 RepID=A0A5B7BIG5_DAVIN